MNKANPTREQVERAKAFCRQWKPDRYTNLGIDPILLAHVWLLMDDDVKLALQSAFGFPEARNVNSPA